MGRVMRAKALSPFVGQRMTNFLARPNAADLLVLKELIEDGKVKPPIGARYPLSDVPTRSVSSGRDTAAARWSSRSGARRATVGSVRCVSP